MGYSDQKNYSEEKMPLAIGVAVTATASGSNSLTTVIRAPQFARKTKLTRFRVEVVTAPAANTTGHLFAVLNGTSTIAVATLGTGTNTAAGAGVWGNIPGTGTGQLAQIELQRTTTTSTLPNGQTVVTTTRNPNVDINAGTELTIAVIATGTASGHAIGTYDVYMNTQDNPA
jgi:hypothetical protein